MRTEEQVDELVDSVEDICARYGGDGIDWDIENGSADTDLDSLVTASVRLRPAAAPQVHRHDLGGTARRTI